MAYVAIMGSVEPASGEQWTITSGDQRATVTGVGGGLRTLAVGDWEVLDGYAESEVAPGGTGQVLAPWPNRIGDGRYAFAGTDHTVALNEPEHGNAIHGLVRWLPWQGTLVSPSIVRMSSRLPAQPGYPWTLDLTTTWALDDHGLRVTHEVVNRAATECPFGLGIHPYLRLPSASVDETVVSLRARTMLTVDDRMLPAGRTPVAGTEADFTTPRPIGSSALDCAYTDLDGPAEVRLSSPDHQVVIWGDESFRWWQLYTGDTLPPERRRRSIAVEPMTCPADAFRSGTDLIVLAPGVPWRAEWGIRARGPRQSS